MIKKFLAVLFGGLILISVTACGHAKIEDVNKVLVQVAVGKIGQEYVTCVRDGNNFLCEPSDNGTVYEVREVSKN